MARKRYSVEQIVAKLREAEKLEAQGMTVAQRTRASTTRGPARPRKGRRLVSQGGRRAGSPSASPTSTWSATSRGKLRPARRVRARLP